MRKLEKFYWEKYSLSVYEASQFYGIGEKRLYNLIKENPNADYILQIGAHTRIKRQKFEEFLNKTSII